MPKVRSNLTLSEHVRDFADATGNASAYIERLLEARMAALAAARVTLSTFSRPEQMAVFDAINGLLFTPGMSAADQITADLEDTEGLGEKWDISPERWLRLMEMTETEASAFRLAAEEFWAGRR